MAQWFKNKKFARNISALLPKVLYLWIIIMRYWEQKIIIKLLHHNLKRKMSYVLKRNEKHQFTRHAYWKKGKCRKKSHNFLVQNFQKKKDLVVLPSTTNITILEIPPSLDSPLLSGRGLISHAQKTSQTNTAFYL